MAHEFERRKQGKKVIWTCTTCSEEIVSAKKPRYHKCSNVEENTNDEDDPHETSEVSNRNVQATPRTDRRSVTSTNENQLTPNSFELIRLMNDQTKKMME